MSEILFVTDDLMFPSRVRSLAQPLGIAMRVVKPAELASIELANVSLVLLDLAPMGAGTAATIRTLKERCPLVQSIAFGPHVDTALLASAQSAGCELVLPRSQFAQRLAEIVAWAKTPSGG